MPPLDPSRDNQDFGILSVYTISAVLEPNMPLTAIVTGVSSSGVSMVANAVALLGIPMGDTKSSTDFEDQEFTDALSNFEQHKLHALIERRSAEHVRWGFKFPSLQNYLLPPQLAYFHNPRLIVVMRDPIAVAAQARKSEPQFGGHVESAVYDITKQMSDMAYFVEKARYPTLLLSYEKLIAFPEKSIAAIAEFCGVSPSEYQISRAVEIILPNNSKSTEFSNAQYNGDCNGIRQGVLHGWCKAIDIDQPVDVELLANGVIVARAVANEFRLDLQRAAIGSGHHSFRIDLATLSLPEDSILSVQTMDGKFLLPGSGRSIRQMTDSKRD